MVFSSATQCRHACLKCICFFILCVSRMQKSIFNFNFLIVEGWLVSQNILQVTHSMQRQVSGLGSLSAVSSRTLHRIINKGDQARLAVCSP